MHVAAPLPDSELLRRFVREGNQPAFTTLVETYQPLVVGAALRRTGDLELSRDVAQEVFTALARKAEWLVDRASLAGWLHQAATYAAARAVQSEARRHSRQEKAATIGEEGVLHPDDQARGAALEEALGTLRSTEREALLLHYFQDLDYAEMSRALGVSEAAARQRVSRGLRRLGAHLRRRGVGAGAAPLLMAAAALQTTVPAQAGLASAALGAASAGPATATFLTFTTMMSHTAFKITAAVVLVAGLPVASELATQARLREQIAALPVAPPADTTRSFAPMDRESAVAAAIAELRNEQAARFAAEDTARAREVEVVRAEEEVVVSLGKVDEMGARFARLLTQISEQKAQGPAGQASTQKGSQLFASNLGELVATTRAVRKMETDPPRAARFYGAALAELLGLDDAERARVEAYLAEQIEGLMTNGVAGPPPGGEARAAWKERRAEAWRVLSAGLPAALPPAKLDASKVSDLMQMDEMFSRAAGR